MIDNSVLERFNDLLIQRAGIHFSSNSLKVLEQRLNAKVSQLQLDSVQAYYELLVLNPEQFDSFLDFVTTNLSYFYREAYHYQVLKNHVIPQFVKSNRVKVRIWSAGCSTGEEPYTLAMLFAHLAPQISVEILASDISSTCIHIAKQAIYPEDRVNKLPTELRHKYLHKLSELDISALTANGTNKLLLYKAIAGNENLYKSQNSYEPLWQVVLSLRQKVQFVNHNLNSPSYQEFAPLKFDLIFCRNVLIYFHPEVQKRVACQFAQVLAADGWLFLGHTEYINNMNTPFIPSGIEPTCYLLREQSLIANNGILTRSKKVNINLSRPQFENFLSSNSSAAIPEKAPEKTLAKILERRPANPGDSEVQSLKDLRARIKKAIDRKS